MPNEIQLKVICYIKRFYLELPLIGTPSVVGFPIDSFNSPKKDKS